MTIDLLNNFIHENLRYNEDFFVISYRVIGSILEIKVNNKYHTLSGFGEVVHLNVYNDWINSKREVKINQIL